MSTLTTNEKFQALLAIDQRANLTMSDGRWVVRLPGVRFYSIIEPKELSGETPDKAIEEAWFRLTFEPNGRVPDGRLTCPAEQEKIIISVGKRERWMRWNGFMWAQCLEQDA